VDNDDPDAVAEFTRSEGGGQEFYRASANAAGGSLLAHASRSDPLSPSSMTAAANIEETIHFTEFPSPGNTVSITATLGVTVSATATTGFARAFGSVRLVGPDGECTASTNTQTGSSSHCDDGAGSAGSGKVTLVLTREQLEDSFGEVDLFASVSAELESFGGIDGSATASGGVGFARGGEPAPGTIHIDVDPPLAHTYTGSQTFFPVPEPGAPLLAAVGGAVLAATRRRQS
jgi:hypothetical protein